MPRLNQALNQIRYGAVTAIGARRLKTLIKKVSYRRMLRRTIVVEMPREYVSIVY